MSLLGGVTIYIYEDSFPTAEPVYGEMHVLDSIQTTLHYAGSTSQFRDISFWLLSPGDYVTIQANYRMGYLTAFTDWGGTLSYCYIRSLSVTDVLTDIKRPGSLGTAYTVMRIKAKLQIVP